MRSAVPVPAVAVVRASGRGSRIVVTARKHPNARDDESDRRPQRSRPPAPIPSPPPHHPVLLRSPCASSFQEGRTEASRLQLIPVNRFHDKMQHLVGHRPALCHLSAGTNAMTRAAVTRRRPGHAIVQRSPASLDGAPRLARGIRSERHVGRCARASPRAPVAATVALRQTAAPPASSSM
ncbi:hypothetical protein AKJ09_05057 [Labilithrix luteola]|uniref:Uncharacterized protein n=1 Tax=Labilithrix luteola TaxID=1391654 RepID=A0A0K1PXY6_9BACT|nr:hypothetical protein AKJ09_05057 [Labilithrix luteola]